MRRAWKNLWNVLTGTQKPKRPRRHRRLEAEMLEGRQLLSVTWSMSGTTLKLVGDGANDWIAVNVSKTTVYFSGTNLKNSSGTPVPGGNTSMPAANVAAIDMSGGNPTRSGIDTLEFTQSGDFQKPVRMYGQDGNDTFRVTFNSGKQAQVSADGGTGNDTANVPANIGTGSFWTNAENGTFGSYVGYKSPSLRVTPFVTSDGTNRSSSLYTRVIQQFAVTTNSRYINPSKTLCNIFAWDVTSAMGAELPHWVYSDGSPAAPLASGASELNVNATVNWLETYGTKYGWKSTTDASAQSYANSGRPAIAIWKNPAGGFGHIAIVRPTSTTFDSKVGPIIAQAGGFNGANNSETTNVKTGFNVGGANNPKTLSDVKYYYY
jgi:hypothetical protein